MQDHNNNGKIAKVAQGCPLGGGRSNTRTTQSPLQLFSEVGCRWRKNSLAHTVKERLYCGCSVHRIDVRVPI